MTLIGAALLAVLGLFGRPDPIPPGEEPGVVIQGGEPFTETELLRALRRFRVPIIRPLRLTDADDAAFFLEEFLFAEGFYQARVEYEFFPQTGVAEFQVFTGERLRLGELSFTGATVFSEERLHEMATASLRQSAGTLFAPLFYVEEDLEAAAAALRQSYFNTGYRDSHVTFEAELFPERGEADVRFSIEEGPQFVVREIRILGEGDFDPASALAEAKNKPFTPDEDMVFRSRFLREMRREGFYDASMSVTPHFDMETGDVRLDVEFDTGPRYSIRSVDVQGQKRTRVGAILSRLGVRPGTEYDSSRLDRGMQRLWFSGAFSEADAEIVPNEDQTLDVVVTVEEGKARQIRGTTGFREWEQFFLTLQYTDRNVLGTLNRLGVEGHISQKSYYGLMQLTDPFLFNTENQGNIGAFYLRQELPAYRATFLGGFAGIERLFDEPNQTGYRLQYLWQSIFDFTAFGVDDEEIARSDLEYKVAAFSFGQTLDRRNDQLSPMQGFQVLYDLKLASEAFGGDLNYFQPEVQATWYLPFREITQTSPFVPFLMVNHRAGMLLPFGGTDFIPLPERFYLGGPDTVRSFQFDGMGPRDLDGDPLGGEIFWLFNFELQYPIWQALYLVGFVDVGNLSPAVNDYLWDETRVAPGLGLRFYTPIGALRVDYGYNAIRREGDPIGAWQFGFGFNF